MVRLRIAHDGRALVDLLGARLRHLTCSGFTHVELVSFCDLDTLAWLQFYSVIVHGLVRSLPRIGALYL